jgi:hypothetical protein
MGDGRSDIKVGRSASTYCEASWVEFRSLGNGLLEKSFESGRVG